MVDLDYIKTTITKLTYERDDCVVDRIKLINMRNANNVRIKTLEDVIVNFKKDESSNSHSIETIEKLIIKRMSKKNDEIIKHINKTSDLIKQLDIAIASFKDEFYLESHFQDQT